MREVPPAFQETSRLHGLTLVSCHACSAWPSDLYSAPEALWADPVLFAIWLMRVWLLANRGELHDDPVVFAFKDPQSLMAGVALGLAFVAAIELPAGFASAISVNHLFGQR